MKFRTLSYNLKIKMSGSAQSSSEVIILILTQQHQFFKAKNERVGLLNSFLNKCLDKWIGECLENIMTVLNEF